MVAASDPGGIASCIHYREEDHASSAVLARTDFNENWMKFLITLLRSVYLKGPKLDLSHSTSVIAVCSEALGITNEGTLFLLNVTSHFSHYTGRYFVLTKQRCPMIKCITDFFKRS